MQRRSVLRLGAASVLGAAGTLGSVQATQDAYGPLGRLEITEAKDVAVDGTVAYVAKTDGSKERAGGFSAVDLSDPANPSVLAERVGLMSDYEQGPLEQTWDLWIDDDRLAIVGPANPTGETAADYLSGVVLFDISSPENPRLLDEYETDFAIHNTFFDDGAVYLSGNGTEGNPLVVLSTTDDTLEEVSRWSPLDYEPELSKVSGRLRTLHDMYVQDGRAYLLYWDAGTWIVDVEDPADPSYVGHISEYDLAELQSFGEDEAGVEAFTPPGNHHYAEVNDDGTVLMVGGEAWAFQRNGKTYGGAGGVELWDISDPAAPTKLSTIDPPKTADNTRGGGQFTTSHNANLTNGRLYTSWYFGGVKIHDVSDPANPVELAWWRDPEKAAFWTAQAVPEKDIFVATSGGLGDTIGALYTFPDREGTQANPPSLLETGTAGATGQSGAKENGSGQQNSSATDTNGGDSTSTNTSESSTAESDTTETGDANQSVPGFGVGAAVTGLGLGAWRVLRSREQ
jgi:hypothetical protein